MRAKRGDLIIIKDFYNFDSVLAIALSDEVNFLDNNKPGRKGFLVEIESGRLRVNSNIIRKFWQRIK